MTSRQDLIDLTPELQSPVDWKKVSDAGFRGAYIKRSQYSGTRTSRSEIYAEQARVNGVAPGYYHFAYVGSDPVKQAQFFFRVSDRGDGSPIGALPGELPPMLDLEYVKDFTAPGCSPKEVVQWGEAFMAETTRLWFPDNRLLQPSDYRYRLPVVYLYPYFAGQLQPHLSKSKLTGYPLCIASYKATWDANAKKSVLYPWYPELSDKPMLPAGWSSWTLWQYSGNNGIKVPGIAQDCDRDLFNGDYDAWCRFLGMQKTPDSIEGNVIEDTHENK